MARELPKEAHLYWNAEVQMFIIHATDGLKDYGHYHWLGKSPVDFGDVVFDEKALKLESLNKALGEAQGKVSSIKEEIQKLLCIAHEEVVIPRVATSKFDDDVPF